MPDATASSSCAQNAFPEVHPEFSELVERYIPVVRRIVDRFRSRLPSHMEFDDLFSSGVTGLLAAVANFTPERSATFRSYAARRISGAIVDDLRKADTRSPRAILKSRQIAEAGDRVEQRYGRPATEEELRHELGLSETAYARWLRATTPTRFLSLDCPAVHDTDAGLSFHESIPDESAVNTPIALERAELREELAARIKGLPAAERKILALYYHEGLKLSEIASEFGVSESRICQKHGDALKKLRSQLAGTADA